MKILVIDDNRTILGLIEEYLKKLGHEIEKAKSAEEGFEIFNREQSDFHLILLDVRLPKMDGFSFYTKIQAEKGDIPVIFMSGHVDNKAITKAKEMGALTFLSKPFPLSDLNRAIEQCKSAHTGS